MSVSIRDLDNGDILLFQNADTTSQVISIFDRLIRYFTKSGYTHTAMVLKDPTWIREDLTGMFVYESSVEPEPDPEDGQKKFGVQLTPLEEILRVGSPEVYVRKVKKGRDLITEEKLKRIHDETHNTLYDFFPGDLLRAAFHVQPDRRAQHTDAMFCSALVTFMCVRFGFLPEYTDWSEASPADLSSQQTSQFLKFRDTVEYGEDTPLDAS